MTVQGILLVDLIAAILLLWVLNLVRRGRLYVGYGVMFVVSFVAVGCAVSVPPVLRSVTGLVGAVFPVSALTFVALAFIAWLFIYVLSQLTIISDRLATVVQELAIRKATDSSKAQTE